MVEGTRCIDTETTTSLDAGLFAFAACIYVK